jgi:sirohydrochlorin ferrochelatase
VKKAVIILGHGSRSTGADDTISRLADEVGKNGDHEITGYAFLQYMQPTLHQALERCIGQGAEKIVIVPFFLQPGTHVMKDVPAYVEKAKRQYPGVDILVTDFVGAHPLMTTIILELVGKSDCGMQHAE